MKYRVILYNTGGAPDTDLFGNFTFYTLNSATDFAVAWTELSVYYKAYLWDGSVWRDYQ